MDNQESKMLAPAAEASANLSVKKMASTPTLSAQSMSLDRKTSCPTFPSSPTKTQHANMTESEDDGKELLSPSSVKTPSRTPPSKYKTFHSNYSAPQLLSSHETSPLSVATRPALDSSPELQSASSSGGDASLKRRQQRHSFLYDKFPSIPLDEAVVEEYVCALNKAGLLIQGKIYITKRRLCFYPIMTILGGKAEIKFKQVVDIASGVVGGFIPNAIDITCADGQKYRFQSFVFRDAAYAQMREHWLRFLAESLYHDNSSASGHLSESAEERSSLDSAPSANSSAAYKVPLIQEPPAECMCLSKHHKQSTSTILIDQVFPLSLESFWNTVYGGDKATSLPSGFEHKHESLQGGFMHWFLCVKRSSKNVSISPWVLNDDIESRRHQLPFSELAAGWKRTCSYDIPLGVCTPKSFVEETIAEVDPAHSICLTSMTRTPDAPLGESFFTSMRFCMMRHGPFKCRYVVSVEFIFKPGVTWITKTAIQKSAKPKIVEYHDDLRLTLQDHIEHLVKQGKVASVASLPKSTDKQPESLPKKPSKISRHSRPSSSSSPSSSRSVSWSSSFLQRKHVSGFVITTLLAMVFVNGLLLLFTLLELRNIHHKLENMLR